jgi:hypothetical protein
VVAEMEWNSYGSPEVQEEGINPYCEGGMEGNLQGLAVVIETSVCRTAVVVTPGSPSD